MANLAIKGHPTRGKEVIEILEILGGCNKHNYTADCDSFCFYIGTCINIIYYDWVNNCCEDKDILVFTLEEFLEKYPYKVGDKVIAYYKGILALFTIQGMRWNPELNKVEYKICSSWLDVSLILPYKETMEENPDKALASDLIRQDYSGKIFGYKIPNGYEFDCIKDNEIILKPKQPEYPKTYEECCKVLGYDDRETYCVCHTGANERLFESLYRLKVCRDTYWKIAGEQMGLDKPWEPDWNDEIETYYTISYDGVNIKCYNNTDVYSKLAFPTKEMRDAFKENFDNDIEFCKEFL